MGALEKSLQKNQSASTGLVFRVSGRLSGQDNRWSRKWMLYGGGTEEPEGAWDGPGFSGVGDSVCSLILTHTLSDILVES